MELELEKEDDDCSLLDEVEELEQLLEFDDELLIDMLEELEDEQMLVQEQLWEDEREELEEVDLHLI